VTFQIELPRALESAATARQAVGELSSQLPEEVLGDVRLLVSELVTNALRHAGLSDDERIGLAVGVTAESVRVEVTDHGRGFDPQSVPSDPEVAEGWGLYLVATLSDRWGVESAGGATLVWFELDRDRNGFKEAA
jgi:anti-sigma regulatory factor (Ser/Thr protein kinase)